MARHRKYGEDLTYGEEHRYELRELYKRDGHRLDQADRDWTEFCHACKEPLVIVEEVRDRGQDITDKATTVTRNLSKLAGVRSILMAWRTERPPEVDREIERLWARLFELYAQHPIVEFRARRLWPDRGPVETFTPDEWWHEVRIWHRDHHDTCELAQRHPQIPTVKSAQLVTAKQRSKLWSPHQRRLDGVA